jgi:hypothetical protein
MSKHLIQVQGRCVVRKHSRCASSIPHAEIPPTNCPLNLDFSDLFEIDGNRISRHRIYYDQVKFMSQLGHCISQRLPEVLESRPVVTAQQAQAALAAYGFSCIAATADT